MKNSRLSQLILTVLLILSCTHKGFAADANPFFVPPPRLKSDVNLDGYQFNLPSKVDKAWIESLRQYISRHFDAGVVLDVGSWSRPHPIYRPRENGSPDAFTLGHGVTIVAVKDDRVYIYDTDLKLVDGNRGMTLGDFVDRIERLKFETYASAKEPVFPWYVREGAIPAAGLATGLISIYEGGSIPEIAATVAVTTAIAYSIRRSVYYMDLFTELRKVKSFKIAAENLYAMMRQKAEQNVIVVRHGGANDWSSSMVKQFLTPLKTRSCANLLHFPLN